MSSYLTLLTETLKSVDLDKTSMYPAALAAGIAHLPSQESDDLLVTLAKRPDLDDVTKSRLRTCRSAAARTTAWREHGYQAPLEEWEKVAITESHPSTLAEMRTKAPWTELSQQAIDGLLERGSTRASKTRFTKKTAATFAELTPSPRMGDLLPEALTLLPTDKVSKHLVGHLVYHLLHGAIPEVDVLNTDPVYLLAHACSVHAEPDEAQEIIHQFPDLPARLRQHPEQVNVIRDANAALPVNRIADLQAVEKLLAPLSDENRPRAAAFAEKAHTYTVERMMELIAGAVTNRNSQFGIPELSWNWERLTDEQRTDTTCVAVLRHAPNAHTGNGRHLCRQVVEFLGDRAHTLLDRNRMLTPTVGDTPPEWLLLVSQDAWVRAISRVTTPRAATEILRASQEARDALIADLVQRPEQWDVQAVRDLAIAWQKPLGVEVWARLTTEQLAKIADQPGVRAWLVGELARPMLTTTQGAVAAAAVLDANAPWDDVITAVQALA